MKDPLQMVDEGSDATQAERELIAAGQGMTMSPEDRAQIWTTVAAACVVAPASVAAGAGAASASAGTTSGSVVSALATWKGVILLAVIGGGLVTYQMTKRQPPDPRSALAPHPATPTPPAAPEAPPAPSTTTAARLSASAPSRPTAARPARPATVRESAETPVQAAQTAKSKLAEEGRAVIAARRALRDGNPALCLRLLDAARAAFPNGPLAQEREALTIQALASSGQRGLAVERAARFLREHPESPHAADLRQITP